MNLGDKLYNLRKDKKLSQEEVADQLNVSRQTISKWETNQSTPDFDKIKPICELYGVSADELLNEKKIKDKTINNGDITIKRAKGIGLGVMSYFIAVVWIMISIPVLKLNPIVATCLFLLICGIATYMIIYTCMVYKEEQKPKKNVLLKQINDILSIVTVIIYLIISFVTMAWHITWIIWIIYGLVTEIIKLIFIIRGNYEEK